MSSGLRATMRGRRRRLAEMRDEEGEELAEIAAIGLDGLGREPPLAGERWRAMRSTRVACRPRRQAASLRSCSWRQLPDPGSPPRQRRAQLTCSCFVPAMPFDSVKSPSTRMNSLVADVLMPLALDTAYSYAVPAGLDLKEGDVVRVPLGTRETVGVVWGLRDGRRAPTSRASPARLDAPPMSAPMRRLVDWIAWYTLAPQGLRPGPRPQAAGGRTRRRWLGSAFASPVRRRSG